LIGFWLKIIESVLCFITTAVVYSHVICTIYVQENETVSTPNLKGGNSVRGNTFYLDIYTQRSVIDETWQGLQNKAKKNGYNLVKYSGGRYSQGDLHIWTLVAILKLFPRLLLGISML
jgi:hypothetical protein